MRITTFRFLLSKLGTDKTSGMSCFNKFDVENRINIFCRNHEIIDIKINTVETRYHNNGGYCEVWIIYTILYK